MLSLSQPSPWMMVTSRRLLWLSLNTTTVKMVSKQPPACHHRKAPQFWVQPVSGRLSASFANRQFLPLTSQVQKFQGCDPGGPQAAAVVAAQQRRATTSPCSMPPACRRPTCGASRSARFMRNGKPRSQAFERRSRTLTCRSDRASCSYPPLSAWRRGSVNSKPESRRRDSPVRDVGSRPDPRLRGPGLMTVW